MCFYQGKISKMCKKLLKKLICPYLRKYYIDFNVFTTQMFSVAGGGGVGLMKWQMFLE